VARSRKTLKKRAREAFERIRLRPDLRKLLGNQASDWSDKQVRDTCAGLALTLAEGPKDEALRVAFKETGLDPSNPFDWRRLLDTFADIHFSTHAPPAPRGARRKWDFDLFDRHVEWARGRT